MTAAVTDVRRDVSLPRYVILAVISIPGFLAGWLFLDLLVIGRLPPKWLFVVVYEGIDGILGPLWLAFPGVPLTPVLIGLLGALAVCLVLWWFVRLRRPQSAWLPALLTSAALLWIAVGFVAGVHP